jgi:hypothetical protein
MLLSMPADLRSEFEARIETGEFVKSEGARHSPRSAARRGHPLAPQGRIVKARSHRSCRQQHLDRGLQRRRPADRAASGGAAPY